MAEKINLAQFDINVDELTKKAQDTKQRIDEIKQEMRDMAKAGQASSEAFINNTVSLRALNREYNAQIKVLDQSNNAAAKAVVTQAKIDAALSREALTIDDLRAQNKELTALRNAVNIATEEGQAQLAQLNAQLDTNNALIKENVSDLEQQKISIGDYADEIRQAFADSELFGGSLGQITNLLGQASGAFQGLSSQLGEAIQGLRDAKNGTDGMTASQKAATIASNVFGSSLKLLKVALIGTGIGAIVVLLGSLIAYLNSSEAASNRLGKILGTIGGIISRLMDYLEPLGELIMDGIVAAFDAMGKAATATFGLIAKGLSALGFDNAAASVRNFSSAMTEAGKSAARLTELEQKLTEANRRATIVQLQYQNEAEKLRQIRDDENLTINQRIKANEDLAGVLKDQLAAERQIAIQALEVANLRIAQDGRTAANLDAQYEAMARMIDIQERITGQESEQLTNRVSLQKEAADQAKDAADKAQEQAQKRVDAMNQELDLYIAQQGIRARTLEQELALEQDISTRRKAILDAELKSKLISQAEYQKSVLELGQNTARIQAEIAVATAERELAQLENRVAIEQAISKAVGEVRLDQEIANESILREERARAAFIKFQEGIISETEYTDAVAQLNQNFRLREAEIEKERIEFQKQQKLEQAELDYQSAIVTLEALGADQFQIQSAQIEQQRQRDIQAARVKYTDAAMLAQAILNINGQANTAQIALDKAADKAKLESRLQLLESVAGIIGEETLLGKTAAAARTIMTTYETAMNAYNALAGIPIVGPALGAAAAVAVGAYGARNVAKIYSTNTAVNVDTSGIGKISDAPTQTQTVAAINAVPPFADGGLVTGGLPIKRANGDNVLATLKLGEVVLNEDQQRAIGGPAIFKALKVPGFATGGMVGSSATVQASILQGANKNLTKAMTDAVRDGARQGTQVGSRDGIMGLSTEQYLQSLASI